MPIGLKTLVEDGVGTEAKMIVITTEEDWLDFKELVFRAMNLWPDAPASLKRLSDMIQHGKVLQNYTDSNSRVRLFSSKGNENGNQTSQL